MTLSGEGPDFVLFLQVGDGAVGSDENGHIGALQSMAARPADAIALAQHLREIVQCARASGYDGLRVAEEGAIVTCLAHVYQTKGPTSVYLRDIEVVSLSSEDSYSVPIPRSKYIVLIPELETAVTHVLLADSELDIQYLSCVPGLSSGANFARTSEKRGKDLGNAYRHPARPAESSGVARERVLREIFFPETWSGGPLNDIEFSPSHQALGLFADLIAAEPPEEGLQRFLTEWPGFLMGLCGFADSSELAFLTKPRIGPNFVADFAIIGASQGGAGIQLIEIEPSSERLFTQKLTPAQRYQAAIGQVTEWGEWISRNERTFVSDMIRAAKALPLWPDTAENGSFRRLDPHRLEQSFSAFGGFDMPFISYNVVVGRWSELQREERERLIYLNTKVNKFKTFTYDQVARQAFQRPITHW
jgi:hypothetical protein